jgi:regulator of RNase E activity RraB
MTQDTTILWDAAKRDRLSNVLEHLIRDGADPHETFEFEGHTFVVDYAKYLLMHLDETL